MQCPPYSWPPSSSPRLRLWRLAECNGGAAVPCAHPARGAQIYTLAYSIIKNAIKEAILEGDIHNDPVEAKQLMLRLGKEMGLTPSSRP